MQISLRQTGGFAGLIRGCELDTLAMPPKDAQTLRALVAGADLHSTVASAPKDARDLIAYEIVVNTGDATSAVVFDESRIPKGMEPLLEFLQDRAGPVRAR